MRKELLYTAVFALLLGCAKEPAATSPTDSGELVPVSYSLTRALGENAPAPPAEGTAYMFVSYWRNNVLGDVFDPVNYRPNPDGGKPTGHYAYMPSQDKGTGILQPCDPSSPNNRWNSTKRDASRGQGLINGDYLSVCMRPAVDMWNNGDNSYRVLFQRKDERMASDPFPISVRGYEVFPLPEPYDDGQTVPIRDIRTKVWFDIIQGTDREFRIHEPQLANAGYWGWYHPLLQNTQISYQKGDRYETSAEFHSDSTTDDPDADPKTGRYAIYKKDDPAFLFAESSEAIATSPNPAPTDGTGAPDTIYGPVSFGTPSDGNGKAIYSTGRGIEQGIFLFANNYKSTNNYLQPGVSFRLEMNGSEFNIYIPFDIDMKANHAYLFRLTVESAVIRVHFRTVDWYGENENDHNVGTPEWIQTGVWTAAGWEETHRPNQTDDDKNIG